MLRFPVVVYGCESWTIKEAECWRINAFELWCWRRLLRVRWTARRSNQSILKETSPEYSLEGLMLKMKLQYFGHLMRRADLLKKPLCWERLRAVGEAGSRGWDVWMAPATSWTWVWTNWGIWWRTGKPGVLWSMGSQRVEKKWAAEQRQQIITWGGPFHLCHAHPPWRESGFSWVFWHLIALCPGKAKRVTGPLISSTPHKQWCRHL